MDWSSSSGWHQHSGWQGGGWGESEGGSWHDASRSAGDNWQQEALGNAPVLDLKHGQFVI
jgi:hypothetical protein